MYLTQTTHDNIYFYFILSLYSIKYQYIYILVHIRVIHPTGTSLTQSLYEHLSTILYYFFN